MRSAAEKQRRNRGKKSLEPFGFMSICLVVKRFKKIAALLLLAFWVPISSHELLEHWGVIHTQAANPIEKHDDDHDDQRDKEAERAD